MKLPHMKQTCHRRTSVVLHQMVSNCNTEPKRRKQMIAPITIPIQKFNIKDSLIQERYAMENHYLKFWFVSFGLGPSKGHLSGLNLSAPSQCLGLRCRFQTEINMSSPL